MSLRLRVLGLVSLVAVAAVAATAYLAFTATVEQVNESAAADRDTVPLIESELAGYAEHHGTWDGIPQTLLELRKRTGQRIKLVTYDGVVVADTDTLEGRTARSTNAPPIRIDPRPTLTLSTQPSDPRELSREMLAVIGRYRAGVRFAACMSRLGLGVLAEPGDDGVHTYRADEQATRDHADGVRRCEIESASAGVPSGASADIATCLDMAPRKQNPMPAPTQAGLSPGVSPPPPTEESDPYGKRWHLDLVVDPCLQKAFIFQTADVAPQPLLAYLGAIDERGQPLTPAPVIAAAILVALLAVAGTALLSRRLLRPIGALTAASQRLGEGDSSRRVPVKGRDEVAALARSFNRMADSLQAGEERQRRLIADVAHELRTPLANLRGYLEALKDGVIPADPALFASLHDEAVLQQRIVDDLQDLALAEAGVLAYHRTGVDLAELMQTCHTAHQAAADAAGVTLGVHAHGPIVVWADPDRLRQVIGNLVTNALRATPRGGAVTLLANRDDADRATIVVDDTGIGIAPDQLPHIFDRFWRADTARGRATGGSGLGLAVARQIVNDHGGRISAASQPGTGTRITIVLPTHPTTSSGNDPTTDRPPTA